MSKLTKLLAHRRATRNIMRLYSGKLSRQESEIANPWRSSEPEYLTEFLGTAHMLSDMDELANDPDLIEVMGAPVHVKASERIRNNWPSLAVAASFLLMTVFGINLYFNEYSTVGDSTNLLRYVTRIGEQKTVKLEDGSIVTLNTGTELLVDITKNHRRAILERGEAYFDIARDTERLFSVDVGLHSVSVLGTEFNIRKIPETFSVAVLEGVVSIHQQNEAVNPTAPYFSAPEGEMRQIKDPGQYRLKAGWVAEFNVTHNKLSGHTPKNIGKIQDWRTGILEFSGTPLFKVIQELNRYSPKKILVEDANIVNMEIYAVVHVGQVNTALSGLEKTLPIKVIRQFDHISIVGIDSTMPDAP